jgi:hypothetical protein
LHGQFSRLTTFSFQAVFMRRHHPAAYGTHSIRRTKPSLIHRRTKNLRAVQLLLGHTKLESTVRYLGIEVEDALELAEQTERRNFAPADPDLSQMEKHHPVHIAHSHQRPMSRPLLGFIGLLP